MRNPWRFSFDAQGNLWVGDVGQNLWEETHIMKRGDNGGWRYLEGTHPFHPDESMKSLSFNILLYEYGRSDGGSVTGGYVYEGNEVPSLRGAYIFGNYVSGRVWALRDWQKKAKRELIAETTAVSSFGVDGENEIYVLNHARGKLFKLGMRK